jgi:hypothetical protein
MEGFMISSRRSAVAGLRTGVLLALAWLCAGPAAGYAEREPLECPSQSLRDAVSDATDTDRTIRFTGVCQGPIMIRTDGLTLTGVDTAIIDGGGSDAVTVSGARGVSLTNIEVRNGLNGILGVNGAHIVLTGVHAHDNSVFGVSLQTASSALLAGVTTTNNGIHGLDLETGSAATVTDTLIASNNRVFGINVNGSSITFSLASVSANGNALGIQIATNANAFISDAATVINVQQNLSTGLTVVSGAHLVSFGGTINASGNPSNGVSVNSKGGFDLDAASTLNSFNNGNGVLIQEASVMTVFNNPQFSGVPGLSTINTHDNTGSGISVQSGSTLTLSNQAQIRSNQNTQRGLVADNGAGVTLVNAIITGNAGQDIQLTFGARADLQTLTFETYTCDATVLVRGSSDITCPH